MLYVFAFTIKGIFLSGTREAVTLFCFSVSQPSSYYVGHIFYWFKWSLTTSLQYFWPYKSFFSMHKLRNIDFVFMYFTNDNTPFTVMQITIFLNCFLASNLTVWELLVLQILWFWLLMEELVDSKTKLGRITAKTIIINLCWKKSLCFCVWENNHRAAPVFMSRSVSHLTVSPYCIYPALPGDPLPQRGVAINK